MSMEEKVLKDRQLVKIEEISLAQMSLEQQRRAEWLYQQLGLDAVVNKVLKNFSDSLPGMDRILDKMFGPYDIKGRAEAVAKVTALITYVALSDQHNKELWRLESQLATNAERPKGTHEQLRLL